MLPNGVYAALCTKPEGWVESFRVLVIAVTCYAALILSVMVNPAGCVQLVTSPAGWRIHPVLMYATMERYER